MLGTCHTRNETIGGYIPPPNHQVGSVINPRSLASLHTWMVRPRCSTARWRRARGFARRPGVVGRMSGGKRAVSRTSLCGWLSSSACGKCSVPLSGADCQTSHSGPGLTCARERRTATTATASSCECGRRKTECRRWSRFAPTRASGSDRFSGKVHASACYYSARN